MSSDAPGPKVPSSLRDILLGATGLNPFSLPLPWEQRIVPPPPPTIQDRWFKDQTVYVDAYVFERCRFDNCALVTEFATFAFRHCVVSPDSHLYLMGPALRTARLLMHILRVKARLTMLSGEEAMFATLNFDGTFTLE